MVATLPRCHSDILGAVLHPLDIGGLREPAHSISVVLLLV